MRFPPSSRHGPGRRALLPALAAALALALAACAEPRRAAPRRQPDVLLLVVDCLRSDHVGVNGARRPATPSIDALAAEGTSFRRAFAQASWTRPSLPTLLTGLYPSEHGVGSFLEEGGEGVRGNALPAAALTVAEGLQAAGYRTALVGEQFQLSPQFGTRQGFDLYHNRSGEAARIHRRFLQWLDGSPARPWFAYLHYLEIHWPYCPPALTRGIFDEGTSALDPCRQWRKLRDDIQKGVVTLVPADAAKLEARYDAELLALDREIGLLVQALRERGAWDETLVVLTADHGEEFLEHGGVNHGQSLHDELLRVPLVVKPPLSWGAPRGAARDELVELRDVTPSLLDAAGVRLEPRPAAPSLLPLVRGERPRRPLHDFVAAESHRGLALRTDSLKLIVRPGELREELYDLAADPGETRDVAAECPQDLLWMQSLFARWRASLRPLAAEGAHELDPETVEGLRALGYLN